MNGVPGAMVNRMSLTSQIRDKNSPVRQFFTKYEKKDGAKNCLALLQSTAPIRPLSFTPSSTSVHSFLGTTTDYLIRYTANDNALQFEHTIAWQAYGRRFFSMRPSVIQHLENLFEIGKQYLDGRAGSDYKAIYSATALAVMDNFYRSGLLPGLFYELIQKNEKEIIRKHDGRNIKEKTTNYLLSKYFTKLGGDQYARDISEMIRLFVKKRTERGSELFGAKLVVFNQSLANDGLVGGADFDCVIKSKSHLVLTDIKMTTRPLIIDYLRQIIGYALLYDETKDNFKVTHIGIYYSRTGSFRSLPIDSVIDMTLTGFKSVELARKEFIATLSKVKHNDQV
jgi:hypothetical protein